MLRNILRLLLSMRTGIRMWPPSWLGWQKGWRRATVLLFPRCSSKTLRKQPCPTWGCARICLYPHNIQKWMSKIEESHSKGLWEMNFDVSHEDISWDTVLIILSSTSDTTWRAHKGLAAVSVTAHTLHAGSSDSWNLSSPNDTFWHSVRCKGQCYMSLFCLAVPSC